MEFNMTKIMLVEDDKSLREIYGVRLLAEGYDIVSAGDGEEALAMAIKERPQLIVSDVMMPKISGFDMLDILRSTTETRDIKVIMMTALSSEEQRQRGESLGADRYLVKSQVGIEDVVRVVHEVLADSPTAAPAAPAAPVTAPTQPPAPAPAAPAPTDTPKPASLKTRIIQPLNDPATQPVDINQLLDKELAKEAGIDPDEIPTVQTAEQERQTLEQELANFQATDDANAITADPSLGPLPAEETTTNGDVPPPPPPPPGVPNV